MFVFLLGVKEITRNDRPLDIVRENCVCSLMLKEKGIKESCRANILLLLLYLCRYIIDASLWVKSKCLLVLSFMRYECAY